MYTYNVQCPGGHVGVAPAGSELEDRCKEYKGSGHLDAMGISPEECPECLQEDDKMNF